MARRPNPPPPPPPRPPSARPTGRRLPPTPVADPASTSLASQARHMSDEARRQIRGWTRAIRAGNEAVAEAKMLASNAYALWNALLDLCPWCKKAVQKEKVVDPLCPRCQRDLLADDPDLHQFWEANWKSIRESHMAEKNAKELALLREKSVGTKSKPKKPINKE